MTSEEQRETLNTVWRGGGFDNLAFKWAVVCVFIQEVRALEITHPRLDVEDK